VRAPSGLREVIEELEKNKDAEFGEMTVTGLVFYKSTLKPSGAEYSVLSECRFS
jgi:2'-5' RNA ligase